MKHVSVGTRQQIEKDELQRLALLYPNYALECLARIGCYRHLQRYRQATGIPFEKMADIAGELAKKYPVVTMLTSKKS